MFQSIALYDLFTAYAMRNYLGLISLVTFLSYAKEYMEIRKDSLLNFIFLKDLCLMSSCMTLNVGKPPVPYG